jgi:hypothetical protein
MDLQEKLDLMVSTLTGKGYDGYIISLDSDTGKIGDIADEYLRQNCEKKTGDYKRLWLTTYPIWNGKDKANVHCEMWINMRKEKLVIEQFLIEKIAQFGGLINRSELNNIPISAVPTFRQANDLMNEVKEKKITREKKGKLRL